MKLIDSHTHLYLEQFDQDRGDMVQRALDAGVGKMLLPNIDSESTDAMHQLEAQFPVNCHAMMGLHPTSVKQNYEEELRAVLYAFEQRSYIAVGEIGLDLYWDKTFVKEQIWSFKQQVQLAKKKDIPVVIHVRNAFDEVFRALDEEGTPGLRGVFHSFSGNAAQAARALDMGFLLGINGMITYKNTGLQKVVAHTDLQKLLLETDAPFLTPVPHRGKRNESANVVHIAEKIAELKGCTIEEIAGHTTENATALFGL
jgi:TatD DNase family protein